MSKYILLDFAAIESLYNNRPKALAELTVDDLKKALIHIHLDREHLYAGVWQYVVTWRDLPT
jgi:hypothetical protein